MVWAFEASKGGKGGNGGRRGVKKEWLISTEFIGFIFVKFVSKWEMTGISGC